MKKKTKYQLKSKLKNESRIYVSVILFVSFVSIFMGRLENGFSKRKKPEYKWVIFFPCRHMRIIFGKITMTLKVQKNIHHAYTKFTKLTKKTTYITYEK